MLGLRRRLIVFLHLLKRDVGLLAKRAVSGFLEDRCTQMASSISYWVFFSIFPLAIFLVTVFGQFLRDEDFKNRVVDALLDVLPLAPVEGRQQIENVLEGVSTDMSLLGFMSVFGLIWGASAMMTAIRISINVAWGHGYRRPAVRGKLMDIAMVFFIGVLVALTLVATTFMQIGTDIADAVAIIPLGWLSGVVALFLPFLISLSVFTLLYRFVPVVPVRFSEIWPGALFAALTFELAKYGFAFYVANFGNYNAIYGSIGAIIVFLVFVYLAANILLFGAEIASEWPRVRAGHYDEIEAANEDEDDDDRTGFERVRDLVSSLIFLDHEQRDEVARPPGEPVRKNPRSERRGRETS
jgi:membrane protein